MLKTLHDEIDAAVLDAYGWGDLAATLADVTQREGRPRNPARTAGRAQRRTRRRGSPGLVRWLRPEFQNPATASAPQQADLPVETGEDEAGQSGAAAAPATRQPWPPTLPEQVAAVARVLADTAAPLSEPDLAARFTGRARGKSACRRSSTRSKRWGACGGMLPERALCDHVQGSRWPAGSMTRTKPAFALPDRAMPSGTPATRLPSEAVFRHRGYRPLSWPRRTTTRDRCRVRLHSVRWRTGQSSCFRSPVHGRSFHSPLISIGRSSVFPETRISGALVVEVVALRLANRCRRLKAVRAATAAMRRGNCFRSLVYLARFLSQNSLNRSALS